MEELKQRLRETREEGLVINLDERRDGHGSHLIRMLQPSQLGCRR
jgi:hypothetical protein